MSHYWCTKFCTPFAWRRSHILMQDLYSWRSCKRMTSKYRDHVTDFITPWLMEPGGSMPHSQGLSNNFYPEPNQPNSPHWYKSWVESTQLLALIPILSQINPTPRIDSNPETNQPNSPYWYKSSVESTQLPAFIQILSRINTTPRIDTNPESNQPNSPHL